MKKRIASLFMAIAMIASLGVNAMALDPVTITPSGVQKFDDVPTTHWAFAYVDKVTAAGMFNGLTPTWFGPADNMTRAQFVTVLARMEGQGALESVPTDTKFSDVDRNYRFAGPIAWATNTGIVEGYSDGTFRPTQAISRAQFAAMIHRYINYKKFDQTLANGKRISLNVVSPEPAQFPDYEQVSDVFKADVDYARTHGLVQGFGDGTLRPNIAINRAQIAAILARFIDVLTDSGYLPFLDGGDARNPIVIRISTTSSPSGGGGGGGGRGNYGGYSAATYTLTINTVGVAEADMANVKYGYSEDEAATQRVTAVTTTVTAPITQDAEVVLGVTPPDGKTLVSITSTDVTLEGSALSGYNDARSFKMTKDATVTVTFKDANYYYVLGVKGGQDVDVTGGSKLNMQTDTYLRNSLKRKLDENVSLVSAFTYLYNDGDANSYNDGGANSRQFQNMVETGLNLIVPENSNSATYTLNDLSDLGGATNTALEPMISALIGEVGNVDFETDPQVNAAQKRSDLGKQAVRVAIENRAITDANLIAQFRSDPDAFVATYVDTTGVKFSASVVPSPSAREIANSLNISASAVISKSGNDATVTVTPVIRFKSGVTYIDVGGTATVRVTGNVVFNDSLPLAKDYKTQSAEDLMKAAGISSTITKTVDKTRLDETTLNGYNLSSMVNLGDYLAKAQAQVDKRVANMEKAIQDAGISTTDSAMSSAIDGVASKLAVSNFAQSGNTSNVIVLKNFSGQGYSDRVDAIINALEQLRWAIVQTTGTSATKETAIRDAINALYGPARNKLSSSQKASADSFVNALAKAGSMGNPAKLGDFYDALVTTGTYFNSGMQSVNIPADNFYVNLITGMGINLDKTKPVEFQFVMWKIDIDQNPPANLFG